VRAAIGHRLRASAARQAAVVSQVGGRRRGEEIRERGRIVNVG